MQTGQIIFLALCAAVFIIGIVLFIYKKMHPDTIENEKRKVSKRLRTFAAPRGFRVLDNVRLVSGGLSGWADHVLVGYFGVLLVYDLCYSGEYYGGADDKQWIINDKGKRYAVDNPRIHAQQCSGRVITLPNSFSSLRALLYASCCRVWFIFWANSSAACWAFQAFSS